jgi:hypothetical protein
MVNQDENSGAGEAPFTGYPAPTSNTTYTPNQFFDVVLRYSSRGCVRLVAYMIRKTLGWSDAEGNPQEPHVVVSYNQLIREAGISRGAIGSSIEEAIDNRFIQRVREGRASSHRQSAVSALFELSWDDCGEYIKDPERFAGFYAGNGNLTYIPNAFFDYTVPNESLAVIKIVGAVIRYTIGFQTKFGFRRQQIEMSFTRLQRITGISSRRSLNDAIQHAIKNNHIQRITDGVFDLDAGRGSHPATYGIKWSDSNIYPMVGSKRIPGSDPQDSETPVQKGYRDTPELLSETAALPVQEGYRQQFKKDTGGQSKKDTRTGSESAPAPVQEEHRERFINDTGIEITSSNNISNNTNKQQQPLSVAAGGSFEKLIQEGFDRNTAWQLAAEYPPLQVEQQCEWLPRRNPTRNRLGMLRKSIEENWPSPDIGEQERKGGIFASHFYAAWAGNDDTPAAPAVASDVEASERFVAVLLKHYPREDKIPRMGRSFGEFVRDKERSNPGMPRSLKLALARHGDPFVVEFKKKVRESKKKAAERARQRHYDRFKGDYLDYLREQEARLRNDNPLLYSSFEQEESRQREFLARSPYCRSREFIEEMLEAFDSEKERVKRFYEFSKTVDEAILDFWAWDREVNPTSMGQEVASA